MDADDFTDFDLEGVSPPAWTITGPCPSMAVQDALARAELVAL